MSDTDVKGLTLLNEKFFEGDYIATYKFFGLEYHCLYVNAEIRMHPGGQYKLPAWKRAAAEKAITTHFACTIAAFPASWHAAHAAIYTEEVP